MATIILGTAGHIDHGKTSLIKALTNEDLDRLKEEKERGITIELGFGSLSLAGDDHIGIVDVPGHEKFIRRMVAGAGGIDIVMLVVAADDGVMPQTKEHLDICQLLGIQHGLVALTKKDLVDEEWLELIEQDITELFTGTFLENAPLIPVSATTGEGIPELLAAIESIIPKVAPKKTDGPCFLPIDRIFTMKGFGTVVTGTLISGSARVGETLEILPQKLRAKVRGIQVHGKAVEVAVAGQRTAINLQGVEKKGLERGEVLSHPDTLKSCYRFDAQLTILPDTPQPLKHGELVRLHLFTTTTVARVICYDGNLLEPGNSYPVQFRLDTPLASIPGARFVIRTINATRTIGGGILLDPDPPRHRRSDPHTKNWFEALQSNNGEEIVAGLAKRAETHGVTQGELKRRVNAPANEIIDLWNRLIASEALVVINPESHHAVHRETLTAYEQKLSDLLASFHDRNPLRPGMPLKEAEQQLGKDIAPRFFEYLVHQAEQRGVLENHANSLRLADHTISLSAEQVKLKEKLVSLFSSTGLTPPSVNELLKTLTVSKPDLGNLLELLVKEGSAVKIKDDLYFGSDAVSDLEQNITQFFKDHDELTPGSLKEMTGISRKYAIPLLEYFDRVKLTIRVGDKRVLRERKG